MRVDRRRQRSRRRRRRRIALLLVLALLAPVTYSYVTTMTRPSSLPMSVRTIEWIRSNHGAWAVNFVERYWYTWHAPKKGGPALKTLPTIGTPVRRAAASHVRKHSLVVDWRPSRLRPLIRPVLPDEGAWHKVSSGFAGPPPVLVTTFRSEPDYPRIVAYVAWIDHTRTQLALYPGRYEPPNASPRGPMEVPPGQRARLLATFNSGFTYNDGHGGFAVNGAAATPLKDGMGTVVAYRNGRVDVLSWRGRSTPGRAVVLARQNLPLLVDRGRANPTIDNGNAWGDTLGNAVRVWRSGVGIDRHGNLIYAAADYQTARTLAAILIHAGAVRAVELDINAEWPSFNTYPLPGARDPVKLVPNYQQAATRYLVPDDRDFFAVYARVPGGIAQVPFR